MTNDIIFIIDDYKERQLTTYRPFIDIENIDSKQIRFIHETNQTSISEITNTACCVCIHDSMRIDIDINGKLFDFSILKKAVKENQIALVSFSNTGNQMTDLVSLKELNLRSDDFYMNLSVFLDDFFQNKLPNLEILALGKNYLREKSLQLKSEMLGLFKSFNEFEAITLDIEDKNLFRSLLKEFENVSTKKGFSDSVFKKLNTEQLNKCGFENDINFIIKFLK
jgi:hypothetical protein